MFLKDHTATDENKLQWLGDWLKNNNVREDNLGVLIFQHYGWDGFSTNIQWWTDTQRQQMLNILCGRTYDNNGAPCNPYNVLGIFTGHVHNPQKPYPVDAGKDAKGNDVSFENFSMFSAASPDTDDGYHAHGYSVVRLTGNKMYIHTKDKYANQFWVPPTERDISTGPGDPNSFWYSIGWDLQSSGDPGSWSPIINFGDQPFGGGVPAGGGAAIADIDGDGKPDLVFMAIDNP